MVFPLYCERVKNEQCPIELPCKSHENSIEGLEYDMDVNIAAFIMTIRVRADRDLMSWKMPLCEFHP